MRFATSKSTKPLPSDASSSRTLPNLSAAFSMSSMLRALSFAWQLCLCIPGAQTEKLQRKIGCVRLGFSHTHVEHHLKAQVPSSCEGFNTMLTIFLLCWSVGSSHAALAVLHTQAKICSIVHGKLSRILDHQILFLKHHSNTAILQSLF